MALNWPKLYKTRTVVARQWGFCEEHIALQVKEYMERIQSLFNQTVSFDKFNKDEVYIVGVDAIHFITNKFHKDLSTAWFDFKNNGAGLTYEFSLALQQQNICLFTDLNLLPHWILPCSRVEMLMFVFI